MIPRTPAVPLATIRTFLWFGVLLAGCRQGERTTGETGSIILATTTSTQDSGILDSLISMFQASSGIDVKAIAVGSGAALEMARRGDADVVLSHAPLSEREYVASGDVTGGRLVMHNDFVIVGPPSDPAGVRGLGDLNAVMRAIARTGPFVSRGDGSGTEKMELALWRAAGIDTRTALRREETGQGMGATLTVAHEHRAYTLTDRATYLALRQSLELQVLFEGDPRLLNIYHAYVVSPVKHPKVKREAAEAFVEFLVSPAVQRVIAEFGRDRYGQPLFIPDAGKDEHQVPGRFSDSDGMPGGVPPSRVGSAQRCASGTAHRRASALAGEPRAAPCYRDRDYRPLLAGASADG